MAMFTKDNPITEEVAANVLNVVQHGLSEGLGIPKPGQMCVEAAVCYALGESHNDSPTCVLREIRTSKIALNDAYGWRNRMARGNGLSRVAIAQLGSSHVEGDDFDRALIFQIEKLICPIIESALAPGRGKRFTTVTRDRGLIGSKVNSYADLCDMHTRPFCGPVDVVWEVAGISGVNNNDANCLTAECITRACMDVKTQGAVFVEKLMPFAKWVEINGLGKYNVKGVDEA